MEKSMKTLMLETDDSSRSMQDQNKRSGRIFVNYAKLNYDSQSALNVYTIYTDIKKERNRYTN